MREYYISYSRLSRYFIAGGYVGFLLSTLLGWYPPLVFTSWVFSYISLGFFLYGVYRPGAGVTVVYKDDERM